MLTGTSPQIPVALLPRPGQNFAIIDLKAVGARTLSDVVQFAITTFGQRSHPNYPAGFEVDIDVNNYGTDDFAVYNAESGGFAVSGQSLVVVLNLQTNATAAYYYNSADLSSADVIYTVPLAALGITTGTKFSYTVLAYDNYFTNAVSDVVGPMQVTLGTPRFDFDLSKEVPVNGADSISITRNAAGDAASPSQSGLLLMYTNGLTGREADAITVTP